MCLDFPGQVVALEGDCAIVQTEGRRLLASRLLYPDIGPGEWVYVAAGTIVDRLDPAEAAEIRTILLQARGDVP